MFAEPLTSACVRASEPDANWAPVPTGMFHGELDANGHRNAFRPVAGAVMGGIVGAVVGLGADVVAVVWAAAVVLVVGEITV